MSAKEATLGSGMRSKFYHEISISCRDNKSRIEKGIVDGEFVVSKIVTCDDKAQELFHRQILNNRREKEIKPRTESQFDERKAVETVVDSIDGVTKHFLLIFTPYISPTDLTKYVSMSPKPDQKRLSQQEKALRIGYILAKSIACLMMSSNYQVYSYQSFFFNSITQEIILNKNSFVGMKLMLNDEVIPHSDFSEIVEVLSSDTLDLKSQDRFSLQLKFRALGILVLTLVLESRFRIYYSKTMWNEAKNKPTLELYRSFLKETPKSFERMLKIPEINKKITNISNFISINIAKFIEVVFVEEKKLTWSEAISLLVPQRPKIQLPLKDSPPFQTVQLAEQILKLISQTSRQGKLLKELGLNQPNVYLFLLLFDEDAQIEELLRFQYIDGYLFSPKKFNHRNQALFKRLLKLVEMVLSKTKIDLFYLSQLSFNYFYNQKTDEHIDILQRYAREHQKQRGKLDNIKIIQYLKLLANNFGVYRSTIHNKQMIAFTNNWISLTKYENLFK